MTMLCSWLATNRWVPRTSPGGKLDSVRPAKPGTPALRHYWIDQPAAAPHSSGNAAGGAAAGRLLAQYSHDSGALGAGERVDVELTVQVIGLVLRYRSGEVADSPAGPSTGCRLRPARLSARRNCVERRDRQLACLTHGHSRVVRRPDCRGPC